MALLTEYDDPVQDAAIWIDYLHWSRTAYPMWCDDPHEFENAALAYDLAVSIGRQFDREQQQTAWEMRENAALLGGVAW